MAGKTNFKQFASNYAKSKAHSCISKIHICVGCLHTSHQFHWAISLHHLLFLDVPWMFSIFSLIFTEQNMPRN